MKLLAALTLTLALASCNATSNRVEWADYGEDPMANPQYMADSMSAGAPGAQHQALVSHVGTWNVSGQMWMSPDAEPMPMTATARIESILDGRYIVEEFKSDFMGMPFEGRLVQGYDNVAKRYWSLWTDSMSTGYMLSHGQETSPGTIEMRGTAVDILTPKGRPIRMTTTDNGDGTYTMRMFDTGFDGEECQSMELRYTRA